MPFLILGLPIFDTAYAIFRRIKNKQPIMSPDRGHLHHRLIDMGFSQKQTVAILYIITMILGLSAVMVVGQGAYTGIIIIATFLLFAFFGGKAIVEHAITENKNHKQKDEQHSEQSFLEDDKIEDRGENND